MLRFKPTSAWMWKRTPALRTYFARKAGKSAIVTRFDGGTRIIVSLSDHIESQMFWQGVQEGDRGEVELLKTLLRPEHVFVDVGANIGVFSLLAAKRVPHGRVYAFEASRTHAEKLAANIKLNDYGNVIIQAVGLSDIAGDSKLYFPPCQDGFSNTGMASQFPFNLQSSSEESVRCTTLDDYALRQDIGRLDIIKIDVEGAELDVLLGARQCIARYQPRVVMEVCKSHIERAGRTVDEIFDFWNAMHYRVFQIDQEGGLCPIGNDNDLPGHKNIYCEPKVGELEESLP